MSIAGDEAGPAPGRARMCAARVMFLALLFLCSADIGAHAQETRIGGRVVDTTGVAVPGLALVMHRVDDTGGAFIAEASSDSLGRFALVSDGAPDAEAVYFVAARLDGDLYIGPFVRTPLPAEGYTVVVGGEPVDFGGAATLPAARGSPQVTTAGPRRWWLAAIPALALVGVAIFVAMRAQGPPADRRTLIRIAQLDIKAEDQGIDVKREREQLVEQLLGVED